jgi:hypothetical protein
MVAHIPPEQFLPAVLLWAAAWHQVPAGSLPDDDIELTHLAGFGRLVQEWRKVRDGALYGFVKASDGRLYHPVICEKAMECWAKKRTQSTRGRNGALARWGKAHGKSSPANAASTTVDGTSISENASAIENDSKGQGQGQGQGQGEGNDSSSPCSEASAGADCTPSSPVIEILQGELLPSVTNRSEVDRAFDAYNEAAKIAGWPSAHYLSGARRRQLNARLDECGGYDGWAIGRQSAMGRAVSSAFLQGHNDRRWKPPGLDWFLKPANFTKLMEGSYDDRKKPPSMLERAATAAAIAMGGER